LKKIKKTYWNYGTNVKNNSKKITSTDNVFVASVNPLVFLEADERFASILPNRKLTPEAVLKYLSNETFIPELDNIKKSYQEIAKDVTRLFIVPAEYKIIEKIIRPLKSAIGSYMIGNSLETIVLCGTVAEMMAIFQFQINELSLEDKPLKSEKKLRENLEKFEKTNQKVRVEKLHQFGLIDNELKTKFDDIRQTRNQYVHKLSKSLSNAAPDAKRVFDEALNIFLKITGLTIVKGKTIMNQKVIDYLDKRNLIEKNPIKDVTKK